MKFSEIKNLSLEELNKRYSQMQEEQFELRMKHSLGQVGNPLQIRRLRKDIARILTLFNNPSARTSSSPSIKPSKTPNLSKEKTNPQKISQSTKKTAPAPLETTSKPNAPKPTQKLKSTQEALKTTTSTEPTQNKNQKENPVSKKSPVSEEKLKESKNHEKKDEK